MLLSVATLAIGVAAQSYMPDVATEYGVLIWLLPLIPGFLWAYFRGWQGAALGFAGAMAILTVGQVSMLLLGLRMLSFDFLIVIVAVSALVTVGLGVVAELLHRERERAMRLAFTDDLTGLPNRRHFWMMMDYEFAAAGRGRKLVVVAFDLDGFKRFNDRHGHGAGDAVLRTWSEILHRNTRRMHLTARVGGEEFITILGDAVPDGALVFVHRAMEQLRAQRFCGEQVTVSAGLAAYTPALRTPQQLLEAADAALYEAKDLGRDRVVVWSGDAETHVGTAGQQRAPAATV